MLISHACIDKPLHCRWFRQQSGLRRSNSGPATGAILRSTKGKFTVTRTKVYRSLGHSIAENAVSVQSQSAQT